MQLMSITAPKSTNSPQQAPSEASPHNKCQTRPEHVSAHCLSPNTAPAMQALGATPVVSLLLPLALGFLGVQLPLMLGQTLESAVLTQLNLTQDGAM